MSQKYALKNVISSEARNLYKLMTYKISPDSGDDNLIMGYITWGKGDKQKVKFSYILKILDKRRPYAYGSFFAV